jgi:hypothetical protein
MKMRALISAGLSIASQPAFAQSPDFDFFALGAIESAHSDKQWCDEHYPAFKEKNAFIFGRSVFAETTGDSFVQAHLDGEPRQRLLAILPKMRAEMRAKYEQMPPKYLEQMCTSFERHLGKDSMR